MAKFDFFSSTIRSARDTVKRDVLSSVQTTKNNAYNAVRGTVGSIVDSGVNNARDAMSSVMRGDVGGALDSITRIPADGMSSVQNVLGNVINNQLSRQVLGNTSSANFGSFNPLQGALGRADPLMSYNWFCALPVLSSTAYGQQKLMWNYVEEATLPFRSFSTNTIYRNGKQERHVSMYNVDSLTLTFYLDSYNKAISYLMGWDSLMSPHVGRQNLEARGATYNLPYVYSKDIVFYLLDNARRQLIAITYVGCFPTNINQLGLNSGTSNRLTGEVTFNVNDIAIDVYSAPEEVLNKVSSNLVDNSVRQGADIAQAAMTSFL